LEASLKKLHGNNTHQGKIPKKAGANLHMRRKVQELRTHLSKALEREAYEQAAQLRDEIRALEQTETQDGMVASE
jgi:protein arginine kinase activator